MGGLLKRFFERRKAIENEIDFSSIEIDLLRALSSCDMPWINCKIRSRAFLYVNIPTLNLLRIIPTYNFAFIERVSLEQGDVIFYVSLEEDTFRYRIKDILLEGEDPEKFLKRCLPERLKSFKLTRANFLVENWIRDNRFLESIKRWRDRNQNSLVDWKRSTIDLREYIKTL
jgi:hypothetical protein